jgi:hypothetical protein
MLEFNKQAFLEALVFEGLIKTAAVGPRVPRPDDPALDPFYTRQVFNLSSGIYRQLERNLLRNPVDHSVTIRRRLIDDLSRITNTITGPTRPGLVPGSIGDIQYRLAHALALQKLELELNRLEGMGRLKVEEEPLAELKNAIELGKNQFDTWMKVNHPHIMAPAPPPAAAGAAPPPPAVAGAAPPPPVLARVVPPPEEEPYPSYAEMVPVDTPLKKKEDSQVAPTFPDQARIQTGLKQDPFVDSQIPRVPGIPKVEELASTPLNTGQVRFMGGNPTI